MIVQYLFSSPGGDIFNCSRCACKAFKITPSANHPSLSLGDYFQGIKEFLKSKHSRPRGLGFDHTPEGCTMKAIPSNFTVLSKDFVNKLVKRRVDSLWNRDQKRGLLRITPFSTVQKFFGHGM